MRSNLCPIVLAALALLIAPAAMAGARAIPSADDEFQLRAAHGRDGALALDWTIALRTHLYRDRFAAANARGEVVPLIIAPGVTEDDPNLGPTEVYRGTAHAEIAAKDVPASGELDVTYQGCAESGICYPPVTRAVDPATLAISKHEPAGPVASGLWSAPVAAVSSPATLASYPRNVDTIPAASSALAGGVAPMLAAFFGFGLLLSLTPCVFPMVPILSGVLARSGAGMTRARGFTLSGAYVMASALAYAALGVAAAWSGENLQAALQTPLVLGLTSLVFVVLALSMFGLYELQLPSAWTNLMSRGTPGMGRKLRGGGLASAAALGFGSALIVGPCVTPPLAAALIYVTRTGDVVRGASALFAMGLGMGLPLVAFGTFGAGVLPKSGLWLVRVKQAFGVVFLGLAITMVARVLPDAVPLALWAALAIGTGVFLGALEPLSGSSGPVARVGKGAGIVGVVYGAALLVGFAAGASDPVRPLAFVAGAPPQASPTPQADAVSSPLAFDLALASARRAGKPIVVDYSAAWCTSCRAFERDVLADPSVRARLQGATVIRADVTASDADSQSLMRRFGVLGPPTLLFLTPGDGAEIADTRLVGEVDKPAFEHALTLAGTPS